MSINILTITGNLGRDAEVRYTPSGKAVTDVAVPATSGWGDNKKTIWVKCVIWGERAEKLAPYLLKGTAVTISGEFGTEEYTARDGQAKTNVTINVNQLQLGATMQNRAEKSSAPAQQQPQPQRAEPDSWDDDIPF